MNVQPILINADELASARGATDNLSRGSYVSLEQAILEAVRALPPDKQYEILDHANRLRDQTPEKKPLRSVKGLWADLDVCLSTEEIDAAQHEMWKNFPRNDL
jgi:hypothetical protein